MMKVMSVFGTRPEAIKMCPLILKMEEMPEIESIVCLTGQHRQMLDQVIDIFRIHADYDLDIMQPGQTLTTITMKVLEKIEKVLVKEKPDIVLVHGDTTTSFAAALAAFYQQIPVGHVEAGLRTGNKYSPFPEEMNRNLTGKIAELHFAPTISNVNNLKKENITQQVYMTGNTVIDAFKTTVKPNYSYKEEQLRGIDFETKKVVLLTAHRRENMGEPLIHICNAVKRLAGENEQLEFLYPVHLNPIIQKTAKEILGNLTNVHLLPPLDVEDMHNVIANSFLVMTDSGGLQEEAPAFGVPVLVLRTETERPEAVEAGTVKIIGVEEEAIVQEAKKLIHDPKAYEKMFRAANPYGDGFASERIIKALLEWNKAELR